MRKILVVGTALLFLTLLAPQYGSSCASENTLLSNTAISGIAFHYLFFDDLISLNPFEPNGNHDWYVTPVEVTFHAKENPGSGASGLKYIYYQINNGAWITHEISGSPPNLPLEYDFSITIADDGMYLISFKAEDWVGNVGPIHSIDFKIDMTPPSVTITSPQNGYLYLFGREFIPNIIEQTKALIVGGLTATAMANDVTAGIDYITFITGKGSGEDAVSPYEFNLPFYLPYAQDMLNVLAIDVAGNSASDGSIHYLKIL